MTFKCCMRMINVCGQCVESTSFKVVSLYLPLKAFRLPSSEINVEGNCPNAKLIIRDWEKSIWREGALRFSVQHRTSSISVRISRPLLVFSLLVLQYNFFTSFHSSLSLLARSASVDFNYGYDWLLILSLAVFCLFVRMFAFFRCCLVLFAFPFLLCPPL